ncbi:hypothetical protein [Micromonospora avicenniae]|uniref:hypothetical protein n=1 Tax=Micromonospora avicenniae TaxID=1198245 RepID=UPI0011159F7D|nr:hypothetical protein [Micromonospora avicenniae]
MLGEQRVQKNAGDQSERFARAARRQGRIQVPDRDETVNVDLAGAVAGNAGDQEPDVEEFPFGMDAELAVAAAGEAGKATGAAEIDQGKTRVPKGPGQHDMRTRRHDPSEELTEGMEKEPTATSATDAREGVRSKERAASRGVRSSPE